MSGLQENIFSVILCDSVREEKKNATQRNTKRPLRLCVGILEKELSSIRKIRFLEKRHMKKRIYVKPETLAMEIALQQMIAGSGNKQLGEGIVQTQTPDNTPADPLDPDYEPNRGRQAQDWDDEEEE